MRLVFDTETSGLWKNDLPADHPSQPAMVQLGLLLLDSNWRRVGGFAALIKPDGWSIEPEAERHHGISEGACARYGVPLVVALAALKHFAESAMMIAAHNAEFDRKVIRASLVRAAADPLWWERKAPRFVCTMERMTPVCQIPGEYGSFKYPSLEEAHRFLFPDSDYSTVHDAEADTAACHRILREMIDRGIVSPASVASRPILGSR